MRLQTTGPPHQRLLKQEPVKIFPRSYGYYTKGNAETQTITYDKGYGKFGWKNKGFKADLSAYTYIVLEIEPTDSRVELHIEQTLQCIFHVVYRCNTNSNRS